MLKQRIIYTSLFFIFFIESLLYVFFGKIWTDENWYYSGAALVSKGLHPFYDYFSHHNPIYYYIYALPQYLFGPSLMAGRFMSFIFTICIGILTFLIAKRLGNRFSGLIALIFLVGNHYTIGFHSMMTYHPLESVFILLFFFILTTRIKHHFKYAICITLLILTIGVRYPIDISIVYLLLFLIYMFIKSKSLSSFYAQLAIAIILLIALYIPYFPVFNKWFFQTIEYPIYSTTTGLIDITGENSFLSILRVRLNSIAHIFRSFFPGIVSVFALLIATVIVFIGNMKKTLQYIEDKGIIFTMIGFLVITEMFYQIPLDNSAVSRIFYYPIACIVAGVFWDNLIYEVKEKYLKKAVIAFPIVLVLISIPIQDKPFLNTSWETSHLFKLKQVSNYLKSNTPENAEIFTFNPPFVIEADRKLSLNMLMEVWQIRPEMTTVECNNNGLVNIEMIVEEISEKTPYALLLKSPGRLEDNTGKGRILIPYRNTIWNAINDNYYLAYSIPMNKRHDEVFNIYYRKS